MLVINSMRNNSHKTAIARTAPSVPAKYVIKTLLPQLGVTRIVTSILDWGWGRGKDVEYYKEHGLLCVGYDPYWRGGEMTSDPYMPHKFDLVTCSYVLNVISAGERKTVLQLIKQRICDGGHVLITMRPIKEIEKKSHSWQRHGDGYITSSGTFQSAVPTSEITSLIEEVGFKIINVIDNSKALMILAQK